MHLGHKCPLAANCHASRQVFHMSASLMFAVTFLCYFLWVEAKESKVSAIRRTIFCCNQKQKVHTDNFNLLCTRRLSFEDPLEWEPLYLFLFFYEKSRFSDYRSFPADIFGRHPRQERVLLDAWCPSSRFYPRSTG